MGRTALELHNARFTIARLEAENRDLRAKLETVEAETRERCARTVERGKGIFVAGQPDIVGSLKAAARAIRSLKDKDQQNG